MFSIANLKRKLITKLFRLRRSGLQRYFNSKPIPQQGKSPEDILLDRVYTLPNAITLSRILASPLLGLAIVYDMQTVALGGCALAAFSDWLDGYIAKNYNQKSHFGSLLDPLADKVIIGTLAIALCYKGLLPLPLCGIILGRDLVLITGSFIIRYRTLPRGVKFFDYSHSSMFSIAPSLLSKVNTGLQFTLLCSSLGCFAHDPTLVVYLEPLWYATGISTIISGAGYLSKPGIVKGRAV